MLVLATFGLASIWMAVFADVGVTLLAVLKRFENNEKEIIIQTILFEFFCFLKELC